MSRLFRLLLVLACMTPLISSALEVDNIFVARVDARVGVQQGLAQGFDQVVIRASGQRSALENPLIRQQRKRLKDYVALYGYIEEEGKRWLEVTFNQDAMEQLIRQANLPIWGSLRPLTLIWLVQEKEFKRELLSDSSLLLEQAGFYRTSQERGVPLALPLLDLDDITLVDQADVWGLFVDPVQQASARYGADQIVLGKLFEQQPGEYQISWSTYTASIETGKNSSAWSQGTYTGSMDSVLNQWWQQLSDDIGGRFATRTADAQSDAVDIAVYNLTDLPRLLEAEKSFAGMAMVSHVALKRVDSNKAHFRIHLLGPVDDFFAALKLDRKLVPLELEPEQARVPGLGETNEPEQGEEPSLGEQNESEQESIDGEQLPELIPAYIWQQ